MIESTGESPAAHLPNDREIGALVGGGGVEVRGYWQILLKQVVVGIGHPMRVGLSKKRVSTFHLQRKET